MKNVNWKISFFGTLTLLISSNLFWVYETLDNAVSHSYFESSCEKYDLDRNNFMEIIMSLDKKDDVIDFLTLYKVEFDSFEKGGNLIISLNSFQLEYNSDGRLIDENKF